MVTLIVHDGPTIEEYCPLRGSWLSWYSSIRPGVVFIVLDGLRDAKLQTRRSLVFRGNHIDMNKALYLVSLIPVYNT